MKNYKEIIKQIINVSKATQLSATAEKAKLALWSLGLLTDEMESTLKYYTSITDGQEQKLIELVTSSLPEDIQTYISSLTMSTTRFFVDQPHSNVTSCLMQLTVSSIECRIDFKLHPTRWKLYYASNSKIFNTLFPDFPVTEEESAFIKDVEETLKKLESEEV